MSNKIELMIEIFSEGAQRTELSDTLLVSELLEEIGQEFEFSQIEQSDLALFSMQSNAPLAPHDSLNDAGIRAFDYLMLGYKNEPPVFGKFELPTIMQASLTHVQSQKQIAVDWYPFYIGRPMKDDNNAHLLVNVDTLIENNKSISRRHVQITFRQNRFYLKALSKKKKTLVNGQLVEVDCEIALADESRIELADGDISFIFNSESKEMEDYNEQ